MTECYFVSDLHGRVERYDKLFRLVESSVPDALFLGGDLLPTALGAWAGGDAADHDFFEEVLSAGFARLRAALGRRYPAVFLILGNDDGRFQEASVRDGAARGLWHYAHGRRLQLGSWSVFGYAYVPPTPFALKDWERYDVSRYVDPGCVSPEEGRRSVPVAPRDQRYTTIQDDLDRLAGDHELDCSVFLFHAPPYRTVLDRAALDDTRVDHVPVDVHVGSIAIRRFIEQRQPRVTLHGHVHEATRLSGSWRDRIGDTHLFGAAHDGPELALVRFEPERLDAATRTLL